jgi:hypothetical protein
MVCSFVDSVKIKEWIEICNLMKLIDSKVCLVFTPVELTIQLIHVSRKCILDMRFPSTWFSDYDWKDSEFYIDTETLFTIFSLYSDETRISMMSEGNFLILKFFHENHNKSFSIPLRSQKDRRIQLPTQNSTDFRMNPNYLYPICQQLSKFGPIVYVDIKKDYFHLISYGQEKMVVEIQPSMLEPIVEGDCENSFELYYVNLFLKFSMVYPSLLIKINTLLQLCIEKEYTLHYYVSRVKS